MTDSLQGPHQGQPVIAAGTQLEEAHAAMILIHGRGATAQSILELTREFTAEGFAYFAPQAAGDQWYPNGFMQPIESNQPGLDSALAFVDDIVNHITEGGIPLERVMLLGFSQGACLATEYSARNAQRYGGVVGLSGGLIGPDGTPRDYKGSLQSTPVFLGCSDVDAHIPKERVNHSAEVLERIGGDVTKRLYPGMGHTVNQDEINAVNAMMGGVLATATG
jgi:predicted esterase